MKAPDINEHASLIEECIAALPVPPDARGILAAQSLIALCEHLCYRIEKKCEEWPYVVQKLHGVIENLESYIRSTATHDAAEWRILARGEIGAVLKSKIVPFQRAKRIRKAE